MEEDGTSAFESVTKLLNKIELLGKSICVFKQVIQMKYPNVCLKYQFYISK